MASTTGGGGLTPDEEKAIRSTWSLVQTDLKGNGAKFFIHFFTGYPEYQKMFRSFADIPLAELHKSKRLIAHGYTVMTSLTALVENLDDPEVLNELLHTVGRNHGRRKVKVGDFENLRESLVDFLGKALGEHWTPEAAVAWSKVLQVIVTKIGEGIKLVEAEA